MLYILHCQREFFFTSDNPTRVLRTSQKLFLFQPFKPVWLRHIPRLLCAPLKRLCSTSVRSSPLNFNVKACCMRPGELTFRDKVTICSDAQSFVLRIAFRFDNDRPWMVHMKGQVKTGKPTEGSFHLLGNLWHNFLAFSLENPIFFLIYLCLSLCSHLYSEFECQIYPWCLCISCSGMTPGMHLAQTSFSACYEPIHSHLTLFSILFFNSTPLAKSEGDEGNWLLWYSSPA